ncbi:MAG TPA: sulfatase-like hydrolase/transferase [Candidatus Tectomicrobia bacterium]|nr:sulfatase-like hydrolase/transferase [Candidatus Tectomicrobia bacterium]
MHPLTQVRHWQAAVIFSLALVTLLSAFVGTAAAADSRNHPNILFFIMDDVGIDQMQIFGYGGETPPRTPNIDAIARAGVRFRNTWAMPECSPSRAIFFEGRYPLRTNVFTAILSLDLANSQVSPFETTTPQVIKKKGYDSGLFGKFHLTSGPLQSDNNPYGYTVVHALGWDFFAGYLDGAPFPIDTTAGLGNPNTGGPYLCGFVPNATDDPTNGADTGACYFADSSCTAISKSLVQPTPGRACLNQGGILVPNQSCQSSPPAGVNFNNQNAYYVSQLVINHEDGSAEVVPFTDPRARVYRSIIESDLAINWINQRDSKKPWMATVSYSSAHTPYQQPPTALLPPDSVPTGGFNCTDQGQLRVLSNQMIEAMDSEIGRVLVELGLATRKPDGTLDYHPEATDTMVIVIGDNGTYAPGVKAPFDPNHAKGFVYQTGVWVPLIVAGPLVNAPDREVQHMVNIADLFELFGEIAGVDVRKVVPKSHLLDSASMLPYLTNPDQESIRQSNFTQTGINITANGIRPPPCVVTLTDPPACVQIFTTEALCTFEGGTWYGPDGAAGPGGLATCCDVKSQFVPGTYPDGLTILDDAQRAIRNDRFKLLQREVLNCSTGQDDTVLEFYAIDEGVPPQIDRPDGEFANNLLPDPNLPPDQQLTPGQLANLNALSAELQVLLSSEISCPGDGNLDKKVNGKDIEDWKFFSALSGGLSSWYDLNFDGLTNEADLAIIQQHLGTNCLKKD